MKPRPSNLGPLLHDLRRVQFLSHAEQACLAAAAQAGDIAARNRLIESVLPFALKQAERYIRNKPTLLLEPGDLFQAAFIELCHAVEKYDPANGAAFITYAGWWIRNGIAKAGRRNRSIVRIPVHAQEAVEDDEGYRIMVSRALHPVNIDQPLREDDDPRELVSPAARPVDCAARSEERRIHRQLAAQFWRAIRQQLPRRYQRVLRLRMEGKTCEQVAKRLGVVRERVRQLETRALRVGRAAIGADPNGGVSISVAFGLSPGRKIEQDDPARLTA